MKNNKMPKAERAEGARLPGSFQRFARTVARTSGHPTAFSIAVGILVVWALTGPFFHFGTTWLLVIDTVANIITFLMIFLIRNAQNRESEAVQLKLDELIRATKAAQNTLLDIEELSGEELDRIKGRFERLARKAREDSSAGQTEFIRRESPKGDVPIASFNSEGRCAAVGGNRSCSRPVTRINRQDNKIKHLEFMNKLELKGDWNIVKGKIKQKWAALTDDDLQLMEGREDELIGRIQKRTGEAREVVERTLHESWTNRHDSPASLPN